MPNAAGLLTVTVVRGTNVPRMDLLGGSDPFVTLEMPKTAHAAEPQIFNTQVSDDGSNPIWLVSKLGSCFFSLLHFCLSSNTGCKYLFCANRNEKFPFVGIDGGEVITIKLSDCDKGMIGTADLIGSAEIAVPKTNLGTEVFLKR